MTTDTFNLVDKRWMPVILAKDRKFEQLNLMDFFICAPEIAELAGDTPLVDAALIRFALAVLYAAYRGPRTKEEWKAMWERRSFDREPLAEYLEKWHDRFDLFDETHPFYQVPRKWFLERSGKKKSKPKSLNKLFFHFAAGNNPLHFSHHREGIVASPSSVACQLIAMMTFASGGGRSGYKQPNFKDAPWGGGIAFLARGDNLFETLMLNLIPLEEGMFKWFYPNPEDIERDSPWWEREQGYERSETERGYMSYLTWPARYVHLYPDEEGEEMVVRGMDFTQGVVPPVMTWDPMRFYRRSSDGGWTRTAFSQEKMLWRESATLLTIPMQQEGEESDPDKRFGLIAWLSELAGDEDENTLDVAKTYNLMAVGVKKSSFSRVDFMRMEYLPLPPLLLSRDKEEYLNILSRAIEYAEEVGQILKGAIDEMAKTLRPPRGGGQKTKEQAWQKLRDHWAARRLYWSYLTPRFYVLMEALMRGDDDVALQAEDDWVGDVGVQAERVLESIAQELGTMPRAMEAYGRGRASFERLMRALLKKRGGTASDPDETG